MHLHRIRILQELFPATAAYPFNLEVLRSTAGLEFLSPVAFFVGENGSGKSTLLRAIARRCFSPPESRWPRSPTRVSSPSGRASTSSHTCAERNAS